MNFLISILDSLNLEKEGLYEVIEKLLSFDTLYRKIKFLEYIRDLLGQFGGI